MATEPRSYDIEDPKELKRLLRELSGYLSPDMLCRDEFLEDGTDLAGRKYALDALDAYREKVVKELSSNEANNCPKCESPNTAVPSVGMRCCFDCGKDWRPCPKCRGEMELFSEQVDFGPKTYFYKCKCGHMEKDYCENGVAKGKIESICIKCELECPFGVWKSREK